MEQKRRGRKPKIQNNNESTQQVKQNSDFMASKVEETQVIDDNNNDFLSFSPLDEEVVERSYNKIEVDHSLGDIPEPDFGNGQPDFSEESESVSYEEESKPSPIENVTNPKMSELEDKDKKIASTMLVNSVLDAYEMLHQFGSKLAKIDESKISEKVMTGEIDLDIRVPISEDADVNAMEYAQEVNRQADEMFAYDPEFGDKVRPAMVRVFQKKGLGITDEQFILGAFAKDIGMKAFSIVSFKKQNNEMIKHFANASQQYRKSAMQEPVVERVTPDSITVPNKQEEEPIKVKTATISVEDIEAEMMND
jgi:hypothetical protein